MRSFISPKSRSASANHEYAKFHMGRTRASHKSSFHPLDMLHPAFQRRAKTFKFRRNVAPCTNNMTLNPDIFTYSLWQNIFTNTKLELLKTSMTFKSHSLCQLSGCWHISKSLTEKFSEFLIWVKI